MNLLDLAGSVQVFHEAVLGGANLKIEYCAMDESVSSASQLNFYKLKHFSKIKWRAGDYLVVPGTEVKVLLSKKILHAKTLHDWARDAYRLGVYMCSVCTGAYFLAMTGILDQKKCTTHWSRTTHLKQKYPAIDLVENILFTEDGRVFTSAGVTSGIDMALHIIGKLKGDGFSYSIARELVVYMRRQGHESQQSVFMRFRNHIHSGIHKVQNFLQEHTHRKTSLVQLAEIACMSTRNLTRVFKKETGISINDYVTLVRKEYIRELLKNPDITRREIAKHCGLRSERQVIRLMNAM